MFPQKMGPTKRSARRSTAVVSPGAKRRRTPSTKALEMSPYDEAPGPSNRPTEAIVQPDPASGPSVQTGNQEVMNFLREEFSSQSERIKLLEDAIQRHNIFVPGRGLDTQPRPVDAPMLPVAAPLLPVAAPPMPVTTPLPTFDAALFPAEEPLPPFAAALPSACPGKQIDNRSVPVGLLLSKKGKDSKRSACPL